MAHANATINQMAYAICHHDPVAWRNGTDLYKIPNWVRTACAYCKHMVEFRTGFDSDTHKTGYIETLIKPK